MIAILVVGIVEASGGGHSSNAPRVPSLRQQQAQLAGSPPALASLHAQASEVLDGGRGAFVSRLAALRGHPVVVYKWAAWCGPCRAEFPLMAQAALTRGREVAFIGVDYNDVTASARTFLRQTPLSFPSYSDPDGAIATVIGAPFQPSTVFYDARGRRTLIHQGPYETDAALQADIARYAST